eukprot:15484309-Alexandrium_andersonii.AAC.1
MAGVGHRRHEAKARLGRRSPAPAADPVAAGATSALGEGCSCRRRLRCRCCPCGPTWPTWSMCTSLGSS